MAQPAVNQTDLEPLARARVLYNPETQVLIIENGQRSEIAEEMAQDVVVFYDKDCDREPTSAVAVRIDCAEHVLRPFIDAVLSKHEMSSYAEAGNGSAPSGVSNHLEAGEHTIQPNKTAQV